MLRKQIETRIDSTSRDAYIVVGIGSEYTVWSKQAPFIYDLAKAPETLLFNINMR